DCFQSALAHQDGTDAMLGGSHLGVDCDGLAIAIHCLDELALVPQFVAEERMKRGHAVVEMLWQFRRVDRFVPSSEPRDGDTEGAMGVCQGGVDLQCLAKLAVSLLRVAK